MIWYDYQCMVLTKGEENLLLFYSRHRLGEEIDFTG